MIYIAELSLTLMPQKLVAKCLECGYTDTIRRGIGYAYSRHFGTQKRKR